MENSKIEWTDHTANLWWGCQKVHTGCKNCYAEALDNRYNHENPHWGPGSFRKIVSGVWKDLNKFQREAAKAGVFARVFVGSMMDIFEDPIPVMDNNNVLIPRDTRIDAANDPMTTQHLRTIFFHNIDTGMYPNLMFLLLTKRPENINKYIPTAWRQSPPKNVMFGASVVDQATALKLIPELMKVKNAKRFLSCEPLVGPIDFENGLHMTDGAKYNPLTVVDDFYPIDGAMGGIHWVICGGESGHNARPMHPNWATQIKEQCVRASVPFFFKQWGEYQPTGFYDSTEHVIWFNSEYKTIQNTQPRMFQMYGDDGRTRAMKRVGKKEAGNLLEGQQYKEFPREEVPNV